jgi:hypothetical protein
MGLFFINWLRQADGFERTGATGAERGQKNFLARKYFLANPLGSTTRPIYGSVFY